MNEFNNVHDSGFAVRGGPSLINAALLACGVSVAGGVLGGCKLVEATNWNLEQLHGEGGRHRRAVELESHLGYFVGHTLGQVGGQLSRLGGEEVDGSGEGEARQVTSADALAASEEARAAVRHAGGGVSLKHLVSPERTCLGQLRDLAAYDAGEPLVAALQVGWFARLAVDDPWTLCRERAVLELGRHGRRLELRPGDLEGLPAGVAVAQPSQVAASLATLMEALRGGSAGEIEGACRELLTLPLDLFGARRLLRGLTLLLGSEARHGAARPLLLETTLRLESICVGRSLTLAFQDPQPRVRAAAMEAGVRAVGPQLLDDFLLQLKYFPEEEERVRLFALIAEHAPAILDADRAANRALEVAAADLAEAGQEAAAPADRGGARLMLLYREAVGSHSSGWVS
ncbi:MAG: hypothetical protein QF411_05880, partial [Planctomycetota bacterium]|nr:hypothetical protein [Planctomycetota bacterium]